MGSLELYKIGFERVQWKYRLCHYRLEDGNFTSIKHARFRFSRQKIDRRVIPASKRKIRLDFERIPGSFSWAVAFFKTWLAQSFGYMVWTIHSTAHLFDSLSSERTRPMYPKRNWVNDTGFCICSSLISRVWFGPISPRVTWSLWRKGQNDYLIKSCSKAKMTISYLDYRVSKASQSIAKLHVCENFLVEEAVNT